MGAAFQEFGFGHNDEDVGQRSKRFKAEGGQTYRVSFAWWPGSEDGKPDMSAPTPRFTGAYRHYIEGLGYILNKGPEYTKLAGEPPRRALGTVLVIWPTDSKGNISDSRLRDGDYKVQPWIFGEDKYGPLSSIHSEFHFGDHDIKISCTDTKYQKMTFAPCKGNLLNRFYTSEKTSFDIKGLLANVQQVLSSLESEIGREMSITQIREKLSGESSSPSVTGQTSQTTEDLDKILNTIDSL